MGVVLAVEFLDNRRRLGCKLAEVVLFAIRIVAGLHEVIPLLEILKWSLHNSYSFCWKSPPTRSRTALRIASPRFSCSAPARILYSP